MTTQPPPPPRIGARRAREAVAAIVQRYFGQRPRRLVKRGGGLTNLVFEFRADDTDYVVRVHSDRTKVHDYLKEQWASARARAAGVPVPPVLEVGNDAAPFPYMVSEKAHGVDAASWPGRLDVLRELGAYARAIHTIRTTGHGTVFDWSSNTLSRCDRWADWLADGFDVGARIATLQRHGALPAPALKRLRAQAARIARWREPPVLQHGDLRLKNVLVDPRTGRISALLDWEDCLSAPGPAWDLAIALHDLGIDGKEAFAAGYGLTPRRLATLAPALRTLNLLNYAPFLQALAERKDRAALAWHRARLQGLFDLYAI